MIEKYIGKRIKEYRKKKEITQEEFAEKMGRSTHYYSSLERGVHNSGIGSSVSYARRKGKNIVIIDPRV